VASRWFGGCRILRNNASSAASKISVISVKSVGQIQHNILFASLSMSKITSDYDHGRTGI